MNQGKRPWPLIVIASLYLLVGVIGFIAHFPELWARHPDAVAIELTELTGAISGVGLLMRQKWARWLALAWILSQPVSPDRRTGNPCGLLRHDRVRTVLYRDIALVSRGARDSTMTFRS